MANSFDVWQKPTQYCKAIIIQLKQKKKNPLLGCVAKKVI